MSNFDRFQPPTSEEDNPTLRCDFCNDIITNKKGVLYNKNTFCYFCDLECMISDFTEDKIIELLGGEYI